MYAHKVLRVNYTTYDMRREQDSINPESHPDIMMVAPEGESHPYLYARVIGIFHINACRITESVNSVASPKRIPFLWIRWLDIDSTAPGGFKTRRLHRLKWCAGDDAFGFIHPGVVLRACMLGPAEAYGKSDATLPGPSIARCHRVRDNGGQHEGGYETDVADSSSVSSHDSDNELRGEDSSSYAGEQHLDWIHHYVMM